MLLPSPHFLFFSDCPPVSKKSSRVPPIRDSFQQQCTPSLLRYLCLSILALSSLRLNGRARGGICRTLLSCADHCATNARFVHNRAACCKGGGTVLRCRYGWGASFSFVLSVCVIEAIADRSAQRSSDGSQGWYERFKSSWHLRRPALWQQPEEVPNRACIFASRASV